MCVQYPETGKCLKVENCLKMNVPALYKPHLHYMISQELSVHINLYQASLRLCLFMLTFGWVNDVFSDEFDKCL